MIDYAFVFLLVVVEPVLQRFVFRPRFRADIGRGDADARMNAYRRVIATQWILVLIVFAIWFSMSRPLSALRLVVPVGTQLYLGLLAVVAMLVGTALRLRSVLARDREARAKLRENHDTSRTLLPHTRREYTGFLALSLTTGFCEELLFRGYLPWFLAAWLDSIPGMFVAVVVFALGQWLQGSKAVRQVAITAAIMAFIVLASGSLIPAMIVHALFEAASGSLVWLVVRDTVPTAPVESS